MVYILPAMEDEQIDWKERYFELLKRVEALEAENKRLRELLDTNSKNSSKPPSQDPFRLKRDSKPSGRKQGGQPGHPGHNRVLVPLEQVTTVIDLLPLSCPNCASIKLNPTPVSRSLWVDYATYTNLQRPSWRSRLKKLKRPFCQQET